MYKVLERYNDSAVKGRIASGIEKNRKADFTVTVKDGSGRIVPGAQLKITQKTHAFKFGVNLFMLGGFDSAQKNAKYENDIKNLFNMGVAPIYWDGLEPERGKPRFTENSPYIYRRPPLDRCVKFCNDNNITAKAHCLSFDFFLPEWIKGKTYAEHNRALEERFRKLSERYADKIKYWEVINETLFEKAGTDFYFQPDLIEKAYELAVKYFPQNVLTINENARNLYPEFITNRSRYYLLVERALNKGLRVDEIGFQAHFLYGKEYTEKYGDPEFLLKFFERYNDFKLPMQITEVSFPAHEDGVIDFDAQTELAKNLYSLWFSAQGVEEIVYWNMVDGYTAGSPRGEMASGENKAYAGLLSYENLDRKPAYNALDNLINKEWKTNLSARASSNGECFFRGFKGGYEVEVTAGGKTKTVALELTAPGKAGIII